MIRAYRKNRRNDRTPLSRVKKNPLLMRLRLQRRHTTPQLKTRTPSTKQLTRWGRPSINRVGCLLTRPENRIERRKTSPGDARTKHTPGVEEYIRNTTSFLFLPYAVLDRSHVAASMAQCHNAVDIERCRMPGARKAGAKRVFPFSASYLVRRHRADFH